MTTHFSFPSLKICARQPVWRSVPCSFDFQLVYNPERKRTSGRFAGNDLGDATVQHFVRLGILDRSEWWESRRIAQLMLALKCSLPTWIFNLLVATAVAPLGTWSTSHNSEGTIAASKCAGQAKEEGKWTSVVGTQPCSCQDRINDHPHARAARLSLSFAVTCSAVGYMNVELVHV